MRDEEFLKRWSRRKRATQESTDDMSPTPVAIPPSGDTDAASSTETGADSADDLDLSRLPPLDSITAVTDITAFLRKGVPPALTREALRRAWLADPAIRDFSGLAENAWDFNDPNAMPGFGPLDYTEEQVRDWVERIADNWQRAAASENSAVRPEQDSVMSRRTEPADPVDADDKARSGAADAGGELSENNAPRSEAVSVAQPNSSAANLDTQPSAAPVVRRTHGTALPR